MKNKLSALLIIFLLCSSCGLVEVCVLCTELNTGIEEEYCGTPTEVQEYEDELDDQGAQYGQSWSCSGT